MGANTGESGGMSWIFIYLVSACSHIVCVVYIYLTGSSNHRLGGPKSAPKIDGNEENIAFPDGDDGDDDGTAE